MVSNPVAVTKNSCFASVLSKDFLYIHATLKRVGDMTKTYSQMRRTDKYSQLSSIIRPNWLNSWVFVYDLNGYELESNST